MTEWVGMTERVGMTEWMGMTEWVGVTERVIATLVLQCPPVRADHPVGPASRTDLQPA